MLDGKVVATLERSCPRVVRLPEILVFLSDITVLDIVVHAMGRYSGGCDWDPKGIVYPNVLLNGTSTVPVPLIYPRLLNMTYYLKECAACICQSPNGVGITVYMSVNWRFYMKYRG